MTHQEKTYKITLTFDHQSCTSTLVGLKKKELNTLMKDMRKKSTVQMGDSGGDFGVMIDLSKVMCLQYEVQTKEGEE